jgi:hypothetical protein
MLTKTEQAQVFMALSKETDKARRALAKAEREQENVPFAYGGSAAWDISTLVVNLRRAQYRAACEAAESYFNTYLA